MSFDSKKNVSGIRTVTAVAIYPNACRYSVPDIIDLGLCTSGEPAGSSYTGALIVSPDSGSDIGFYANSNPYMTTTSGEIIKVTIDSSTQVTITARGQLGTAASSISTSEPLRIMHGGEADGSCKGYPQLPDGSGCSTADSFDRTVERELLFPTSQNFNGQIYFNGLQSVTHTPVELKPGTAMAKNASVRVSILDNDDGDAYTVPYPSQRTTKATLFKKLLARHPYMQNRRLVTFSGFLDDDGNFDRDECIEREYIIDTMNLNNGTVSISCLDPLMLAEAKKAKYPETSNGRLAVAINDTSTQISLSSFGLNEYGSNGDSVTVNIEDELIDCTVNDATAGILDIVTRAVGGSEKKDHDIESSVQYVPVWENFNPVTKIIEVLQSTNIESRFYDDYTSAENAVVPNMGKVYIRKPEAVEDIIDEVIRSWSESGIALYFDEVAKKVRIKVSSDFGQQPLTLSDSGNIKQGSITVDNNYSEQVTRASIGFAPFNAGKKVDDENASIIYKGIDLITETTGTLEPLEDDEFYSRFLTNSDTDIQIAVAGTNRISQLNKRPPIIYTFDIDYKDYGQTDDGLVEEGEIINVTSTESVDDNGDPKSENLQIISLKENPSQNTYTVKAKLYQDIIVEADFDFVITESKEDYDLSADFAPTEPGEYTVFISSGVTIGATSANNPAMTTGAQANGVTLNIINRGSILGAGGRGADGVYAIATAPNDQPERTYIPGNDGYDGGNAIELTCPCTFDVTQGVVYSGGGGAPSTYSLADSTVTPVFVQAGNGGSGGQGYVGGLGGAAGSAQIDGLQVEYGEVGEDGSRSRAGTVGGLSAGAWGESSDSNIDSGNSALPGYAILSNGNNVIIVGDNSLTIKGRRDF
ncbi:tail fiber protein [Pseudoalteromonas phage BS5]|uniref:tail fiber protein n=1 Tax=Pseudoalteromonas phage BS5 TaxID=1874539 RepID=UPI0008198015|nr:tail fiber protein [Pseudoalteromonas phage BS5]ANY29589.1 glycine-rich cell wall structural protein 1 precursor [Pseudoalteromonas phage BS5]